jgi:23S rRNA (adenine2030-N6)-methyltransferase
MRAFERDVATTGIRKVLQLELAVRPERWTASLRGCGLLAVNPPFRFDTEAQPLLDWLWRALAPAGDGGARVRWLVPE